MTLTCTVDDEIQLNTVGQYFKQTWPDDAAVILEHIQTLFDKTAGGLPLPGKTDNESLMQLMLIFCCSRPARQNWDWTFSGRAGSCYHGFWPCLFHSTMWRATQLAWISSSVSRQGIQILHALHDCDW